MRKTTCMAVCVLMTTCLSLLTPIAVFAQEAQDEVAPRPIFINITTGTEDIQQASMALSLATNCRAAGREVTVFLNVHAIELAVSEQEECLYKSRELFTQRIASLVEDGVIVIVCPMCLGNSDYTEDDLLPGVQVAGGENFFPPLDGGAAVFSY